jgi:hypothetical protein
MGGVLLLLLLAGCADPAKAISAGSYRNAVEDGTAVELQRHGVALRERPVCRTDNAHRLSPGGTLTTRCTASTVDGSGVVIDGVVTAAGTPGQHERYTFHVHGRPPFEAQCLGVGCRDAPG